MNEEQDKGLDALEEQEREREAARERARQGLRDSIGEVAKERTTESGRACVSAAQYLVDLGDTTEARHWVSLSISADKAQADIKLHQAVEKLERKGAKSDKFKRARRGTKLKAVP